MSMNQDEKPDAAIRPLMMAWRGYPVAQRHGEFAVDYLGYRLEVVRDTNGWTGESTWDAFVDGDSAGSCYRSRLEAKQACVAHAEKLGPKAE